MTPRKNPYTLKGFMSILQGNTSKQEPLKKEQPKKKIKRKKNNHFFGKTIISFCSTLKLE